MLFPVTYYNTTMLKYVSFRYKCSLRFSLHPTRTNRLFNYQRCYYQLSTDTNDEKDSFRWKFKVCEVREIIFIIRKMTPPYTQIEFSLMEIFSMTHIVISLSETEFLVMLIENLLRKLNCF